MEDVTVKGGYKPAAIQVHAGQSVRRGPFEPPLEVDVLIRLYDGMDALDRKHGKHIVYLGSSLPAMCQEPHVGERAEVPARKLELFKGETGRKRLDLPMLGEVW